MGTDMRFDDIDLFCDILATPGDCGIDTETTIDRSIARECCLLQLAHEDGRECILRTVDAPELLARAMTAIDNAKARMIAHNAIFELEVFQNNGADPEGVECTMMLSKVLKTEMRGDNTKGQRFSLAAMIEKEFGVVLDKDEQKRDWRLPLDESAIKYAIDDAIWALKLWQKLEPQCDDDDWSGYTVIRDALPALAECNLTGMTLDTVAHAELCDHLVEEIADGIMLMDLITGEGVENYNSPKQVGEWIARNLFENPEHDASIASMLFAQVTDEFWPTTSLGFSLDKNVVGRILSMVEIVSPVVGEFLIARAQWMKAVKMYQAFGPKLREKVDADGRLRGSFKPHGAKTTRMSCVDPNLQQMPNDPMFREMFITRKGRKFCIADYGQQELRIGCIIGDDVAMQQVFAEGGDIHSATAVKVFHISADEFDPDNNPVHTKKRKQAKGPNFLALYGGGVGGLALATGMSTDESEEILTAWLRAYPGIARYRNEAPKKAEAAGFVQLASGQKLKIVRSSRPAQMINAPVQGGGASVAYRALANVRRYLREAGLFTARICGPVHDEIIVEADDADAPQALECLESGMLDAMLEFFPKCRDLGMDALADGGIGDTWAAKP